MLPPWNIFWQRLRPYLDGSIPGVRTTNWYMETNSPTLYLSWASIPSFSDTAFTFYTPGDRFLDLLNKQDSKTGTVNFAYIASLGTIIGAMKCLVPSGSSTCCGFIISWILCMLIPHLQYHIKSSFWELDRFWFSLEPTHGPQNWV